MAATLALALLLLTAPAAIAADWGGIEPGVSTLAQVRERYGLPSRESRLKVEGYDTIQWLYELNRAPAGIAKMKVDYGLLVAGSYKPDVVRLLTLEPKPLIFGRQTVVQGWGLPDGVRTNPDGTETLVWKDGLFVTLDKEGENAIIMVLSPPQPELPGSGPVAPAPAAPKAAPKR